jgi:hypothetical protein
MLSDAYQDIRERERGEKKLGKKTKDERVSKRK